MPLIKVKLFKNKSLTNLLADVAAYKAGDGAELADSQRGMALELSKASGVGQMHYMALAHGGLDVPAAGSKTANLQHLVLSQDKLAADMQAAIDEALSNVVHASAADGVTTTANRLTSASDPFGSDAVGRKIKVGDEVRTITVRNGAGSVDYDGATLAPGTGVAFDYLGAEVLQAMELEAYLEADQDQRLVMALACEGELA